MADNPIVLGYHFLVELAAFVAVGYWGWAAHDGSQRWVWALAMPLLVATIWAVFRVPGDGGDPIVVVPGIVRLVIELGIMAMAVGLLYVAGQPTWAVVLGVLVIVDYALQYDRVARLLGT